MRKIRKTAMAGGAAGLAALIALGVTAPLASAAGPPQALEDEATTTYTTPVVVDVLDNDTYDDTPTTAVVGIEVAPTLGTAVVNADRTITYTGNTTPDSSRPARVIVDSFSYKVTNTLGSSIAVVNVYQRPPLGTPVAADDNIGLPIDVNAGVLETSEAISLNDTFRAGRTTGATFEVLTQGSRGTAVIETQDPTESGGLYNQTAVARYTLTDTTGAGTVTDSFTYRVCDDGGCSAPATVTATIVYPNPNFVPDPRAGGPVDSTTYVDGKAYTFTISQPGQPTETADVLGIIGGNTAFGDTPDPALTQFDPGPNPMVQPSLKIGNDNPYDSRIIYYAPGTTLDGSSGLGTFTLNADNTVTYRLKGAYPAANGGSDSARFFTCRPSDGLCRIGELAFIFSPDLTGPSAVPVADDTIYAPRAGDATSPIFFNDFRNPDGSLYTSGAQAYITTAPTNGIVVNDPTGFGTVSPQLGIIYRHNSAGIGNNDTFTYQLCPTNTPQNDPLCGTATVNVVIIDPPAAVDDITTTTPAVATPVTVLANDTFRDLPVQDAAVSLASQPGAGTVTVNGDRSISYTYTGQVNVGQVVDSFTYSLTDLGGSSTATVRVTVNTGNPLPQAPVVNPDSVTTGEDEPVTIAVLANDSDPAGGSLNVTQVTAPGNGIVTTSNNQVTYTPNDGFSGIDTFSYIACSSASSLCGSAVVTVTVTPAEIIISGSGTLNAKVREEFDGRLAATVTKNGQPLPGESVVFTIEAECGCDFVIPDSVSPRSAVRAANALGGSSVTLTTGADGSVTTPVIVAGSVPGSYGATATVVGRPAAGTANYTLNVTSPLVITPPVVPPVGTPTPTPTPVGTVDPTPTPTPTPTSEPDPDAPSIVTTPLPLTGGAVTPLLLMGVAGVFGGFALVGASRKRKEG